MKEYYFYVSGTEDSSAPLMGKFFKEDNGKLYAVLRNSPKLKRGSLVIVKEQTEEGESENEERYYITNIEPIHNNNSIKKSKVYLETECEHAERRIQNRHFWIPVIISLIALIKSFDRELVLLWKLITLLLK